MENLLKETKFIMNKYNISADKSLGQNFLIDDEIVEEIVEKANINKEDFVIEIGPGLGTLTKILLEKAGKVTCVELDKRMINILQDRFSIYSNFELINNDILKVNLQELIEKETVNGQLKKAKVVANLPYYITTPIIMKLLEENLQIESITVMVQKEVADRLASKTGDNLSGAITYAINYYANAEKIIQVPKECFLPSPKVDSTVIKLELYKQPPIEVKDKQLMFKIIKMAFEQKRKTLVNALSNAKLLENKETIEKIVLDLGLDLKIRGEKLTLNDFAKISDYIIENDLH